VDECFYKKLHHQLYHVDVAWRDKPFQRQVGSAADYAVNEVTVLLVVAVISGFFVCSFGLDWGCVSYRR
jgi:hypothetical protein